MGDVGAKSASVIRKNEAKQEAPEKENARGQRHEHRKGKSAWQRRSCARLAARRRRNYLHPSPCPGVSSSFRTSSRAAINRAPSRSSTRAYARGEKFQTLLGVTGSGKTFTAAKLIETLQKPTLVLAPNKTLAAQLYQEFRDLFPQNAVQYFVSYYDYYQPEAYVPVERHVHREGTRSSTTRSTGCATRGDARAPLAAPDVIIVASVSCIYGIGSAESYHGLLIRLEKGVEFRRDVLLRMLVDIQYQRNDVDFHRGTFRVRGDVVEIFPAYEEKTAIRIEFFGDEIEAIKEVDPIRGKVLGTVDRYSVYPGSHYVTEQQQLRKCITAVREELRDRIDFYDKAVRFLEKQRIEQRTMYDLELLGTDGLLRRASRTHSRHLSGRKEGEAAADADRLLPERLFDDRRRVAPDDPPDWRDVSRRSCPKRDAACRVRLPPAGARSTNPAPQVR